MNEITQKTIETDTAIREYRMLKAGNYTYEWMMKELK